MSLPSTGYLAARLSSLLATARSAIWTLLGKQVPLESGTLLGNLTDSFMTRLDEQSEAQQAVYDAFDERTATGVYLDNLASLVGVTRLAAAKSVVTLTLGTAGVPAVVVPVGSSVADAAGVEWILQASVTIPGLGTIDGTFSPVLTGPTQATAGTLDVPGTATIKTPVAGWATVLQSADAVLGRDRELDENTSTEQGLRLRRRSSLQNGGSASTNAIRSALTEISGVSQAKAVDNCTSADVVVGGVTLRPNTFLAVVYPDPTASASLKALIAEAIWRRKPAGIYAAHSNGVLAADFVATVVDVVGTSQEVRYSAATAHALTCAVTVTDSNLTPDADIKAAIIAAVGAPAMGALPKNLTVYAALDAILTIEDVPSLTWGGGVPTTFDVATLVAGAITVTHI